MTKKQKLISDLHYPLWLLKDFMWMCGLPMVSLLLALPAIFISLWMCMMTAEKAQRENKMILWWLLANTMWMCSEKFEVSTLWLAYLFFGFGIMEIILYIRYLLKNKHYD